MDAYELRPFQRRMVNKILDSDARFHLIMAPRRIGKTNGVVFMCLYLMGVRAGVIGTSKRPVENMIRSNARLSRDFQVLWIGPYATGAASTAFNEALNVLRGMIRNGVGLRMKPHRSYLQLKTRGAEIKFTGMTDPDGLRGRSFDLLVVDEVATMDINALKSVMFPMLRDNENAKVVFLGTGRSDPELVRLEGFVRESGGTVTRTNYPALLSRGEITRLQYDEAVMECGGEDTNMFLTEYCGVVDAPVPDAVLEHWTRPEGPTMDEHLDAGAVVVLGVDVGVTPFTVVTLTVDRDDRWVLHDLRKYNGSEALSEVIAAEHAALHGDRLWTVLMPHDAARRTSASTATDLQIWKRHVRSVSVVDRHHTVDRRLRETMSLINLVSVAPTEGARAAAAEMMCWRLDRERNGHAVRNGYDHSGDALSYALIGGHRARLAHRVGERMDRTDPEEESPSSVAWRRAFGLRAA